MDDQTKNRNKFERDPDFEVQETPDYLEQTPPPKSKASNPAEPERTSSPVFPEPPKQTEENPPPTKSATGDPETLAIQRPIESLFSKDQGHSSTAQEEIGLPSKKWSKKQEKKMKKKNQFQKYQPAQQNFPSAKPAQPDYSKAPDKQSEYSKYESPKPTPGRTESSAVATIPPPPLVREETPAKPTVDAHTPSLAPFKTTTPTAPSHPLPPSKGIAYVDSQNRVKFTGGYKIYPGDILKVGNQDYMVKEAKKNYTPYYIAGAATLLFLILIFTALLPSKAVNSGNITGIVVEQSSRALVPGVDVTIRELGLKVQSNALGFFNFQMVPQGTYTIQASVPGYDVVADQATVTRKKTSNLALVMSPVVALRQAEPYQSAPRQYSQASTDFESGESSSGAISLKVSPSDATVWVDNQKSKGSVTFRNLKPGSHTVKASRTGYDDWEKSVTVKPGQTSSVKINLERISTASSTTVPRTLDEYVSAAKSAYESQDYAAAIKNYNQAAALTGNRGEVYLGRGLAYSRTGDRKAASNDFLTAAQTFTETERYGQAAEAYSYYLELNPSNEVVLYQRGKTYLMAGNYPAAAQDISQYVQNNPKALNAVIDLGRAYYYAGDYQNSVEAYKKAKKINSMDKRVHIGLAKAYMGLGDRKSCKSAYDKFRELASYMDRKTLQEQDSEWQKVLDFLQIKEE